MANIPVHEGLRELVRWLVGVKGNEGGICYIICGVSYYKVLVVDESKGHAFVEVLDLGNFLYDEVVNVELQRT